jgi:STE24 endopeptidase
MNIYLVLIPTILVFEYALDLTVELLNLKAVGTTLPKEFENHYDGAKYKKSQSYLKENTKFSLIVATLDLVIILAVIYSGLFGIIDDFARSFGHGQIFTAIIFSAILLIASKIIHLPFSIYDTFVIEERYGFNKTTPKTFVLDIIKGLVLSAVLGGVVLAGIIWFFEHFGRNGWIYVWVAVTLFELFVGYVTPVVIMPLFNKFTPLDDGELKTKITGYAKKQNFKLKGIYKMDGSKRSTKANAFFTGFGKYRRIVLLDTLIEKLSTDEILAVLAHEMGHFKKKHIMKGLLISILHGGFMLFVFSLFLGNEKLITAFGFNGISVYAGLIGFGILFSPINMLVSTGGNWLSRKFEYEADRYTVKTIGSAGGLIDGLKKLTVDSLGNLTPHPLKIFLDYSHPPILERIRNLRKI